MPTPTPGVDIVPFDSILNAGDANAVIDTLGGGKHVDKTGTTPYPGAGETGKTLYARMHNRLVSAIADLAVNANSTTPILDALRSDLDATIVILAATQGRVTALEALDVATRGRVTTLEGTAVTQAAAIAAEAVSRASADTTLSGLITTEAAARASADSTHDSRLTALEALLAPAPTRIDVTAAPYSAVGDGTTNDRVAIESARLVARVGGKPLYFPPTTASPGSPVTARTYKVTWTSSVKWFELDWQNWEVCGAGQNLSIISFDSDASQGPANTGSWAISTAYTVGTYVTVAGSAKLYVCTTSGTSAGSGAGPAGTGTGITDGTCVWSNVAAYEYRGFNIASGKGGRMHDIQLLGTGRAGADPDDTGVFPSGLYQGGTSGTWPRYDIHIFQVTISGFSYVATQTSGTGTTHNYVAWNIRFCDLSAPRNALALHTSATEITAEFRIDANIIHDVLFSHAIYIGPSSNHWITRNRFANLAASKYGVQCWGSTTIGSGVAHYEANVFEASVLGCGILTNEHGPSTFIGNHYYSQNGVQLRASARLVGERFNCPTTAVTPYAEFGALSQVIIEACAFNFYAASVAGTSPIGVACGLPGTFILKNCTYTANPEVQGSTLADVTGGWCVQVTDAGAIVRVDGMSCKFKTTSPSNVYMLGVSACASVRVRKSDYVGRATTSQGVIRVFSPGTIAAGAIELDVEIDGGTGGGPAIFCDSTIVAGAVRGTIKTTSTMTSTTDQYLHAAVREASPTVLAPVSTAATLWVASTAYRVGQLVKADSVGSPTKLYRCITAGTSAASGGPTGTAADITDGTVHWKYMSTAIVHALLSISPSFDSYDTGGVVDSVLMNGDFRTSSMHNGDVTSHYSDGTLQFTGLGNVVPLDNTVRALGTLARLRRTAGLYVEV